MARLVCSCSTAGRKILNSKFCPFGLQEDGREERGKDLCAALWKTEIPFQEGRGCHQSPTDSLGSVCRQPASKGALISPTYTLLLFQLSSSISPSTTVSELQLLFWILQSNSATA